MSPMTASVEESFTAAADGGRRFPKRRYSRYGYHENANEAAKVVEEEPVEAERDISDEPNASIEGAREQQAEPPAFE